MNETYFASEPIDKIADAIKTRFVRYLEDCEKRGRLALWRRAHRAYYGRDLTGGVANSSAVTFGGDQGEQVLLRVNEYRSLVRRLFVMATEQRPAFEVSTSNDTPEAMQQAQLAQQVVDYYLDEGGIEAGNHGAAERALVYSEGWLYLGWAVNKGETVAGEDVGGNEGAPSDLAPVKAGELEVEAFSPIDIARDLDSRKVYPTPWAIVRKWENRWDLASSPALSPELADRIRSMTAPHEVARGLFDLDPASQRASGDYIPTLTLYHGKTPAVPEGRMTSVCGDVVIFDGPLPYDAIPLYCVTAAEAFDEGEGYADSWDLLALQEAVDRCASAMASTQDAWGEAKMMAARSQGVTRRDLGGGVALVEYDSDGVAPPPAPMAMPAIPPSTIEFASYLASKMETLSGVNATARGNPGKEGNTASGMALMQAQALQWASGYQASAAAGVRWSGNQIVSLLQRYATAERLIEIAGRDKARHAKSFTGADLQHVRGVRVEVGNPLMRTISGKREQLDWLLANYGPASGAPPPWVISPEQALAFLSTGRLEPTYEHERSEVQSIRAENDRLIRGEPVKMLILDHHMEHIKEHACVFHDPEIRFAPAGHPIADNASAHIREHMDMVKRAMEDPVLYAVLSATGQVLPPPLPPMAGPPMGPEGGAPEGGPPPDDDAPPPADRADVPGVEPSQLGAPLPMMPESPMPAAPGGVQ